MVGLLFFVRFITTILDFCSINSTKEKGAVRHLPFKGLLALL
jgi:hypothetical protein